jgi:membrane-associated protease RseP (regulator of RpoE activity)
MSRLDEELKVAFQRREPSADFAARVLARLDEAPIALAPPSLWQRLAGLFALPAWRFAAAGAMVVLLIAVGVIVWRAPRTTDTGLGASSVTVTADMHALSAPDSVQKTATNSTATNLVVAPSATPRIGSRVPIHHRPAVVAKHAPSAEAEAAKEKVLFALQITSETLNEVQRVISDDQPPTEKPEPVQNR